MPQYRLLENTIIKGANTAFPAGTVIETGDELPNYLVGKVEPVKRKHNKSKKSKDKSQE